MKDLFHKHLIIDVYIFDRLVRDPEWQIED